MKRLLLFVLLGLDLTAVAGDKQPVPDDSRLKARLWFFTAQRIWRDRQLNLQQLPLTDNLTLVQVRDNLRDAENNNKADEGVYTLYKDVRAQVNPSAPPQDVTKEIIEQLKTRQRNKPAQWKQVRLDSLDGQFVKLLTTSPVPATNGAEAKAIPVKNATTGNKATPNQAGTSVKPTMKLSKVQQHPVLSLLLAGFIGSLFGGLATAFWLNRKILQADAKEKANDNKDAQNELADLKGKLHISESKVKRLELDLEDAKRPKAFNNPKQQSGRDRDRDQRKPSLPAPAPMPAVVPAVATPAPNEVPIGETIEWSAPSVPAPAPLPPPTKHYAPATENGFLEDRILQPDAQGHLSIELTIDPAQRDQARFTLNPHVNQPQIIGDDVDRLKEFFSFLRPEKIRTLRAGTAGVLRREEGGWRVEKKAGLELS